MYSVCKNNQAVRKTGRMLAGPSQSRKCWWSHNMFEGGAVAQDSTFIWTETVFEYARGGGGGDGGVIKNKSLPWFWLENPDVRAKFFDVISQKN